MLGSRGTAKLTVTVLSPHRDDAIFSLAGWLRRWASAGISVNVLNFYTVSEYAPWLFSLDGAASNVRAHEDRSALFQTEPTIAVRSRRLLDAPLRLGKHVPQVMGASSKSVRADEVSEAARVIFRSYSLVLCPLGLGGHIDHLTIRCAAILAVRPQKLAFYEDLPYASWTPEWELKRTLAEVQSETRVHLKSAPLKQYSLRFQKRSLAARYRSQIRREDAEQIAWHRPVPGACERLWIPCRSGSWNRVLSGHPKRF